MSGRAAREVPYVRIDKHGNVVCPHCRFTMKPDGNELLAPGIGKCGGCRRQVAVSVKNAREANEIVSKTRAGAWKKDILKQQEAPQPEALPPETEGGKGIIV
jgi:ribosomal protein L37AE/L43A